MRSVKMTAALTAILALAAVSCGVGQPEDESICELHDVEGTAALSCSVDAAWGRAAVSDQDEAASETDTHLMVMTASQCPKMIMDGGYAWCLDGLKNGFCHYSACPEVMVAPR